MEFSRLKKGGDSTSLKQRYYTLSRILETNANYYILLGERSNGKSYAVKHFCIQDFIDNDNRFILLRRYTVESKNFMMETYFDDVDVFKITKGEYNTISIYRNGIYFAITTEDNKIVRGKQIGMVMSLSIANHYKSMSLLKYKNLIYEEFITDDIYIKNEPFELQNLVSTIARRNTIKVFLIGNTISRLCPYFTEWSLVKVPRQKMGTIDIYNMETSQKDEDGNPIEVKIAVEMCENSGSNSKMFFGAQSNQIVNGTWKSKEFPHIPYNYRECEVLYGINFVVYNMIYTSEILQKGDDIFLFTYPANKIKKERVVQPDFSLDMLKTDRLIPLTKGDIAFLKLVKLNKLTFSDNLTGEEFYSGIMPLIAA